MPSDDNDKSITVQQTQTAAECTQDTVAALEMDEGQLEQVQGGAPEVRVPAKKVVHFKAGKDLDTTLS